MKFVKFVFCFGTAFFCFFAGASLRSDCQNSFVEEKRGLSSFVSETPFRPADLLSDIPRFYPSGERNGKNLALSNAEGERLDELWKSRVLELLPQFQPSQLWLLLDNLVNLNGRLDLDYEKGFFRELERAGASALAYFDKKQLVEIVWIFIKLDISPPQPEFLSSWREAARQKKGEFSYWDRAGLRGFFHQMGVSSSQNLE